MKNRFVIYEEDIEIIKGNSSTGENSVNQNVCNINIEECPLKDIVNLSVRLDNVCNMHNIITIKQFLDVPEDEWRTYKNCGSKTIREIYYITEKLKKSGCIQQQIPSETQSTPSDLSEPILLKSTQYIPSNVLDEVIDKAFLSVRINNLLSIFNIKTIRDLLNISKKDFSKARNCGRKSIHELEDYIKKFNIKWDRYVEVSELSAPMVANTIKNDTYTVTDLFNNVAEFVNEHLSGEKLDVYNNRILNDTLTLQDIADRYNQTRERVRQIESKIIEKISLIFLKHKDVIEDLFTYYGNIIGIYNANDDIIKTIYQNLELLHNISDKNTERLYIVDINHKFLIKPETDLSFLSNAKEDITLEEIKNSIADKLDLYLKKDEIKKIENYNHVYNVCFQTLTSEKYVFIDNCRIGRRQGKILNFFLKRHCREEEKIEDVWKRYNEFLSSNNLQDYRVELISFGNMILGKNNVLISQRRGMRFYDIYTYDIDYLCKQLNFEEYNNLEISTKKLYIENQELMKDYDIRDEYELYSLLKNNYNGSAKIEFSRTPVICIGDANRNKQICDFAKLLSPIKVNDLAELYEFEYGIKANNVIANFIPYIKNYISDGIIKTDMKFLSEEQIKEAKEVFTDDFYFIEDAKSLLKTVCPNISEEYFNSYNFNQIGYVYNSEVMVANKWNSPNEYFRFVCTNKDILNLNEDFRYRKLRSFLNVFYDNRSNFKLFSLQKNVYASMNKLNEIGIYEKDIQDFLNLIENVKTPYSTLFSIKSELHSNKLYNYGLDEIFYSDIIKLSKKYSFVQLNNTLIFRNDNSSFNLSDFIIYEMNKFTSIKIRDFMDYLLNQYGIPCFKHDILQAIADTEIYYDNTTEYMYIGYKEFQNEKQMSLHFI